MTTHLRLFPSRSSSASFFCLARAAWIPYAVTWDDKTGEFRGVEAPRGFASYREAAEASRFLMLDTYSFQGLR